MTLLIDESTWTPAMRRILAKEAPAPLRQMAAKGIAPGLKPVETATVLVVLSRSEDKAVSDAASATLGKLPPPLLNGLLTSEMPAAVVDELATRYSSDAAVVEKLLGQGSIDPSTVIRLAQTASEQVAELIATNEERLLRHPEIVEKLYMNKATRMSTADRILELAVRNGLELPGIPAFREAAAAIVNELIPERTDERTPDDELFMETETIARRTEIDPSAEDTHHLDETTGEEVVRPEFSGLHAQIGRMTVSQKIRRAMVGTASERLLLVRDRNKLVAQAVARSPALQENEVARITASRTVPDEVLRIFALDKQWSRSHQIKLNLVSNPRTPLVFASKLIPHLREHELKALAKSKNVSGAIAKAAKQQLERKHH